MEYEIKSVLEDEDLYRILKEKIGEQHELVIIWNDRNSGDRNHCGIYQRGTAHRSITGRGGGRVDSGGCTHAVCGGCRDSVHPGG